MSSDAENRGSAILLPGQEIDAKTTQDRPVAVSPLADGTSAYLSPQSSSSSGDVWLRGFPDSLLLRVNYESSTICGEIIESENGVFEGRNFSARMDYRTRILTITRAELPVSRIRVQFEVQYRVQSDDY